jgi:hypothetical protein
VPRPRRRRTARRLAHGDPVSHRLVIAPDQHRRLANEPVRSYASRISSPPPVSSRSASRSHVDKNARPTTDVLARTEPWGETIATHADIG